MRRVIIFLLAAVTLVIMASPAATSTSEAVDAPARADAVDVGTSHACALTTVGGVKCWGFTYSSPFGEATPTTPTDVPGLSSGVAAISSGGYFDCALTAGQVKCWGANALGQLGNGTFSGSTTPVNVAFAPGVQITAIAAGAGHACALTTTGDVQCWGWDGGNYGEGWCLPSGCASRNTPAVVAGISGVVSIDSGFTRTCAVTNQGAVKCWMGNGDWGYIEDVFPDGIAEARRGGYHGCAITTGGAAKCWGDDSWGQLGDGVPCPAPYPIPNDLGCVSPSDVIGLQAGTAAVAAGGSHSCALTTLGGVKCWGYQHSIPGAVCPQSSAIVTSPVPVDVAGLEVGVTSIAAGISGGIIYGQFPICPALPAPGGEINCVVMLGGNVKCWRWRFTPQDVPSFVSWP